MTVGSLSLLLPYKNPRSWREGAGPRQTKAQVVKMATALSSNQLCSLVSVGTSTPARLHRHRTAAVIGRKPTRPFPSLLLCRTKQQQDVHPAPPTSGKMLLHRGSGGGGGGVPVYVMLPLDTVDGAGGGSVRRRKAMEASLAALRSAGVEGVMADVWWGIAERDRPGEYRWGGYDELFDMARRHGLKVQAVMSFHHCGGNVGDSCTIPLPAWVAEEMEEQPELSYTDRWRRRSRECLSLGCDTLPVLRGRTPVQCYADFMRAFHDRFDHLLGSVISEIQVGMGPAGELRYPSYPEQDGTWSFPGVGAFQCYDKHMLASLKAAATAAGKPEWGSGGGPSDSGGYKSRPQDAPFFQWDGHGGSEGWSSPYGEFFLSWYSQMLLDHGERVLSAASSIFSGSGGVRISGKVAGVHWHYGTPSHAAELAAGYYNTLLRDGYSPVTRMMARHGAVLNFTCVEMRDGEQPGEAGCRPESLVRQGRRGSHWRSWRGWRRASQTSPRSN